MLPLRDRAYSKRLADILDLLSDTRMGWKSKWQGIRKIWRETQ